MTRPISRRNPTSGDWKIFSPSRTRWLDTSVARWRSSCYRRRVQGPLEYFQQAIGIDPDYALAHVGIADSYNMLADYGSRPPKDAFPHAMAAARKALAIDETLAEAHTALTWARWVYELDWSRCGARVSAIDRFERGLRDDPSVVCATT